MALPPQCEIQPGFLVFRELAHPDVLAQTDDLFDHTCFVACTNGLRPLGPNEIDVFPLPELEEHQVATWGGAHITPEAADQYRSQGYVLAEIRLPAQRMGLTVPPGAPERPALD